MGWVARGRVGVPSGGGGQHPLSPLQEGTKGQGAPGWRKAAAGPARETGSWPSSGECTGRTDRAGRLWTRLPVTLQPQGLGSEWVTSHFRSFARRRADRCGCGWRDG